MNSFDGLVGFLLFLEITYSCLFVHGVPALDLSYRSGLTVLNFIRKCLSSVFQLPEYAMTVESRIHPNIDPSDLSVLPKVLSCIPQNHVPKLQERCALLLDHVLEAEFRLEIADVLLEKLNGEVCLHALLSFFFS